MDQRIYRKFSIKEILIKGTELVLQDAEKDVIGEISLKIYVNGDEYASLLCLNQFTEELATGFLFTEGVIDTFNEIIAIKYNECLFPLMIDLAPRKVIDKCETLRSVTSGCGRCFTCINPLKNRKYMSISNQRKFSMVDILKHMREFYQRSQLYKKTGGVHSVLFYHDDFTVFSEDIGRHNCFDKIAGVLLKDNKIGLVGQAMLFVSGRVSSEIITKVIRIGVPVLVSRSTPTVAAVNLARKYNITLIGYVTGDSGYVYSGEERLADIKNKRTYED